MAKKKAYSHLEGKVVYGHQVHAAIVGTGDTSLCYSLKRCCPENGTKIDMTLEILRSLPNQTGAYTCGPGTNERGWTLVPCPSKR